MHKLTYDQIIELANMVAADIKIPYIPGDKLRNHLLANPPMPQVIQTFEAQLWVDRYYIAFSITNEPYVHYIYITSKHAHEELQDLTARIHRAADKSEHSFLTSIRNQLRKVEKVSPDYYIRQDYRKRLKLSGAL